MTTLLRLPDDDLVAAARRQDHGAFEALMRRYNRRLFRVARSILRDDAAAEDAVQESYFRAFTHLDRYQPGGAFGAWLTRIAINQSLMLKRRKPTMLSLEDAEDEIAGQDRSLADALVTPDSSHATGARQLLEQALDTLPLRFRTVFMLRMVEQLSTGETAACLAINEATVKTRLHRAQARLRADISRRLRREHLNLFEFAGARCDRIVANVLARLSGAPVDEVTPLLF